MIKSIKNILNLVWQSVPLGQPGKKLNFPIAPAMSEVMDSGKRLNDNDASLDSPKRVCHGLETSAERLDRTRRRKFAMLLGYCGHGYFGMQRNMGFKTIEEELMIAFKKADLINDNDFEMIQNLTFQRAARTDKGVSAVRQVVSLKLPENASAEVINRHLPPAVRVFGIKRVTKGFNSKNNCDARTYSYTMPTSAFSETDFTEDYRISPELLQKISETLALFVGTHKFHNFTAKKVALDPSSSRYIMSFECGEPFVREGMEFITLKIKGQSFMLHQIRKMVGLVVAIVRGLAPAETIIKARGEPRYDIAIAPGLGLVLERVHYDKYNRKYGKDGIHETLNWDECEEEINAFKDKYILQVIVETEKQEKTMSNWVESLKEHSFDVREDHEERATCNGEKGDETEEFQIKRSENAQT